MHSKVTMVVYLPVYLFAELKVLDREKGSPNQKGIGLLHRALFNFEMAHGSASLCNNGIERKDISTYS